MNHLDNKQPQIGEKVFVLHNNQEKEAIYSIEKDFECFFVNGKPEPKIKKWRY